MSKQIAANSSLAWIRRELRVNGPYLIADELVRRAGVAFRRRMLAGRIGHPDIFLGPRCYIRGLTFMRIGRNFRAAEGLWLEAIATYQSQKFSPAILIGNNVSISRWSHIAATHRIEIGEGVLIGSGVLVTDHQHGQYTERGLRIDTPPSLRPLDCDRTVVIGNNVWLGDGVVVMPGVSIGESSVIGANSVVTRDIPPFSIATGAPATALKEFDFTNQKWRRL